MTGARKAWGQAAFEQMLLLAFVLFLGIIAWVLLREGLLVNANEQVQAALITSKESLTIASATPTPVTRPAPPLGEFSGTLLDAFSQQTSFMIDYSYDLVRGWVGFGWFLLALGLGILIFIAVRRVLIGL